MIGIVIAMASLTIAVAGALLTLSLKLGSAKDDARTQAVIATGLTEQNKAKDAQIATLATDLKTANARVEALDAENQKLRASMPVAGSFDRMLQEARSGVADGGASVRVVPDQSANAKSGSDELLDPAKA
jgi:hypothetical protein